MGTKSPFLFVFGLALATPVAADTPGDDTSWSDIVSEGESLAFGRFIGKFESADFRSRQIRLREIDTGDERTLEVGDGLGYIAEKIPPGTYHVVSIEAVYYPRVHPLKPDKYRPIRQRFGVKPKTGDAPAAVLVVPAERPVYMGTIEAATELDGVVYRGHQLRVFDDFDEAYGRLENFYPSLVASLGRGGITPARSLVLRPTLRRDALERVAGLDDPIRQARGYIADRKFKQAVSWLETFMPTSDVERHEVRLLVGEALLGDRRFPEAIEVLGEVLLASPGETRALRLLARAHAYNGDLAAAQSLYQGLAELIPDDAEAHLHLGYIYALEEDRNRALDEFGAAFKTDFDYLLHDVAPFFVAMKAVLEQDPASYEPPRVMRYRTPPPKGMDSRRSAKNNFIAVLIDHQGKVLAAHIGAENSGSTPLMMLSLVNATYSPASLNGIPIPSLITMGQGTLVQ